MAQARPGPPPVIPPRIDLGETEETCPNINNGLQSVDLGTSTQEPNPSASVSVDTVKSDKPVMAVKPRRSAPLKPPVVTKPKLSTDVKANKPKLKETKGRPEISIISACPMDQSNFVNKSVDQRGIGSAQAIMNTNNNSSDKPLTLSRTDVTTVENKCHNPTKSSAPMKPSPYNSKLGEKGTKSQNSLAPNKGRVHGRKTANTKKDSSTFYVDTSGEENFQKGAIGQVSYSKIDDQLNVKLKPAGRKNKPKPEQRKQPEEADASDTQPETIVPKSKPKPTIITSKKPKVASVGKESKGSGSVEPLADEMPPGRPNVPPSAEINRSLETTQPQRPKAPPNSIQEQPIPSGAVKKKNERLKSAQKRPKSKPPRPPMSKDAAKTRPSRPAPSEPNISSKKPAQRNVPQKDKKSEENLNVVDEKPHKQSGPARATAQFDYNSETADDLPFKAGDTIMLVNKLDDDWFVGYLENDMMRQGIFPASFVDVVVPLKEIPKEKAEVPSSSEPYAVALHDFQGQSDGELSFTSGETIVLTERINEDWLKGRINQAVGIFPQTFVRVERDLPVNTVTTNTVEILQASAEPKVENLGGEWCRATHDYQGDHDDDLSFVVGNEIRITERLSNDWFRGVLGDKTGIFPATFVEIITKVTNNSEEMVFVAAIHDYNGETAGDLSFNTGDKIKVVERINADWLFGILNGKEGLFPVSFVQNVPETLPQPSTLKHKDGSQTKNTRFVKAIHDFSGEHPGELHFQAGDTIEVIRDIDSSWCEGTVNDVTGIFPTTFVEMETSQSQETACAKALYDYEGDSPEDLSFKTGDVIQLLQRVNEDWCTGSLHGKTGQFPTTFVEFLRG